MRFDKASDVELDEPRESRIMRLRRNVIDELLREPRDTGADPERIEPGRSESAWRGAARSGGFAD